MTISVFGVLWLACGFIAAGFANAYWYSTPTYNTRNDVGARRMLGLFIMLAVFGLPYLLITAFVSGFGYYGWSLSANGAKRNANL